MDRIAFLIGKDANGNVNIDAQKLVTGRTCVIAQSGAGKSYLIAVLCEQFLKNNIPFCIIDTEGEYFSLREKYKMLWVGGKKADISIDNTDLKKLALKVVEEGIPLIFDVSDVLDEREIVGQFTEYLYEAEDQIRTPYLLMVEESDKFVPQSRESMKKIEEISRRGRKRGLGLLLATQRPALVNKNVLSQCGNQMIGKLTTENDLQAVNLFFGSRKELEELPELEPGEFFVMGDVSRKKIKVKIKERETKHKGVTPILMPKRWTKVSLKEITLDRMASTEEPEEKKVKTFGIKPVMSKGDALNIASPKRSKKYVLFGKKEDIKFIELQLWPMAYVEMKQREGLLKKKYSRYSFVIDAQKGSMVHLKNGLKYSKGFENLIGLNEREIKIMKLFEGKKKLSLDEIKAGAKISSKNISSILRKLEKRDLIDYSKTTKTYIPLAESRIPEIKQHEEINASDIDLNAKHLKSQISETSIREVIKAISSGAEIIKIDLFYYPVYSVNFEKKIINIDAVNGKEI